MKWLPSIIPDGPKGGHTRVRITYVDDAGQIYYHAYTDRLLIRQMRKMFASQYEPEGSSTVYDQIVQDWKKGDAAVCFFAGNTDFRGDNM